MRWLLLLSAGLLGATACKGGCQCGDAPAKKSVTPPSPETAPSKRVPRAPLPPFEATPSEPGANDPPPPIPATAGLPADATPGPPPDSGSGEPSTPVGAPDAGPAAVPARPAEPKTYLDGGVFAPPPMPTYLDAAAPTPENAPPASDASYRRRDAVTYADASQADPNAPAPDGGVYKPPDAGYLDASR